MKKSFVQKGGAFTTVLILILTHIQAQQLDPNFKPSVEWSYGRVFDFEKQPDGKIILAGDFQIFDNVAQQHLVRINPDGTPDPSFNTGAGPDQRIVDIVLQPDGKLLVLGPFTSFDNQPAKDLVRLNSDGSIDVTFDTGTGFNASPNGMAIQTDGEILVTGPFTSYIGTSRNHLIRLHSDGSPDTGFDIGAGLSGGVSYIITIQPADNKIIL
ncbi:MAG TPA: delta-60 repeat domain-containing protein, partial [Cyclobacteriaceae bacterium]|nr:delta-60 repeat domain-containing protein [Cyclobacteriaceae bacterium]